MYRALVPSILVVFLNTAAEAYSNPFCASSTDRDSVTVGLECSPTSGVISRILFASYGAPDVTGPCGSWSINTSCDLPGFVGSVEAACLNQTSCIIAEDHSDPDPCEGVIKTIAIEAECSALPGGEQIGPLVPSCATEDGTPPCPLPQPPWTPTWQLNRSTICQPGNTIGFLNASAAARFGLVSLDWSIASGVWRPAGTQCNATSGAATLVEQCRQIKAVDSTTKCFVYRNTELALEWLEPQRAVMEDPSKAGYFLQYQPGNPEGQPTGTVYNEDAGGPASGCKQYFWNYSNPEAAAYVLSVSEQGPLGIGSPYVDGTFLDDSQAIPQEHPNAPHNMGLTQLQLLHAQNDTYAFVQQAIGALASEGHYIWQGFDGNRQGDPDAVAPAPTASNCQTYMTELCSPSWQAVPMTMQWDGRNTTLAAFLVGRGPVAYIGWGWNGQPLPDWDPMFDLDVGEPLGLCTNSSSVFSRAWSRGTASIDCADFTATLDF